jgi:uncharacterized protein (DUF1501 family)
MINRRSFLKQSAVVSGSLMMPRLLSAQNHIEHKGKALVIIQLFGGNDGLNTIVPHTNDLYYKLRPQIALKSAELIPFQTDAAFNKKISILPEWMDRGEMLLVNNVGYPKPSQSHFRSQEIWESASDAHVYESSGWLGRWLDIQQDDMPSKLLVEIGQSLSLALKGKQHKGLALLRPEQLHRAANHPIIQATANHVGHEHAHETVAYLHRTLTETSRSAAYIYEQHKIFQSKTTYPQQPFAQGMKTIAELICSGSETSVYYISISGFDTHAFQKLTQNNLLKQYSDSLRAFMSDLKSQGRWKDTLVMTFSEFGRRVKQNGSNGTDHGTANAVWLSGGGLKKTGMLNALPDLSDLNNGDLKHQIDFRQIYATLLEKWLDTPHEQVLKRSFDILPIL